jgi:23S rRNA (pseudouridine1915-N3)-methyltransferase
MKLELWVQGQTAFDYIKTGMEIYEKRLKHFIPFESVVIVDIKNAKSMTEEQLKQKEGEQILKKIDPNDYLILLDERGKQFSSLQFSELLESYLQSNYKRIIFLIGGAYGFSEEVYKRANAQWSLSKLTFSHQMVRLFVVEQIYRGMSILRGLPYHHE